MKKIEEVKKHLAECGYTMDSLDKIFKFLIDVRAIDGDSFEMEGMHGDLQFEDFVNWFYTESVDEQIEQATNELKENVEKLKDAIEKLDKNHPLYELMKTLGESLVDIAEESLQDADDENEMDLFEIDCHEALDNIFAALHSGEMNEKEKDSVINALSVLIALGDEYEG